MIKKLTLACLLLSPLITNAADFNEGEAQEAYVVINVDNDSTNLDSWRRTIQFAQQTGFKIQLAQEHQSELIASYNPYTNNCYVIYNGNYSWVEFTDQGTYKLYYWDSNTNTESMESGGGFRKEWCYKDIDKVSSEF